MIKTINITGLDCANCALELSEELNKINGINADVNFIKQQVKLNYENEEYYNKAIDVITHFEEVKIVEDKEEISYKKDIIRLMISVILVIPYYIINSINPNLKILSYSFLIISYLIAGYEVLIETFKNILKGRIFDENFLMTIASIGAMCLGIIYGDGMIEGVAVMVLYEIGEMLQCVAVNNSKKSITSLMNLKSDYATLIVTDTQQIIKVEDLKINDIVLVKVGEKIPIDGVIIEGETLLDEKSLNGEPTYKEAKVNSNVLSGAINVSGVIKIKALNEYKNSTVYKILELIENATSKKAPAEKFITKFAKYYTPIVCILALIVGLIVPTIISSFTAFSSTIYFNYIYKALSFLVISCPCALVISVPLSYFVGIGKCAKNGILVKGATVIDTLNKVTICAFDKTGTLTKGEFKVTNFTSDEVLDYAVSCEKLSNHPISKAFTSFKSKYTVVNYTEVAGLGIKCEIDGNTILVGSYKLLENNNIEYNKIDSTSTIIYVTKNNKYLGYIEIDDQVKENAKDSIADIKKSGINKCYMLSGDNYTRAKKVANILNLDGFKSELLPNDKVNEVIKLKEQGKILYVGDGINDAPCMACSDVSVSMGKLGSDASIEVSDIVLVNDNLDKISLSKKISKKTISKVWQNIILSLLIKLVIMILSIILPNFPLIIAVVADVGVMLLAVLNALLV